MTINLAPRSAWENPLHFITFGFGSGAMPYAPGTFGTLFAIPFYLLVADLPLFYYGLLVILLIIVGSWLCGKTCHEIGVHDHPGTVLDEFVGFFVTMFAAPKGWSWIILGFILFRVFDIWKPQPIAWLDAHIKGGLGVVVDDVVAGIYAGISLQVLAILFR